MECRRFNLRLQVLLDARRDLASDGGLRRHAATCPECRRRLHLQLDILKALRPCRSRGGEPARTAGRSTATGSPERRRSPSWIVMVTAALALGLMVLGVEREREGTVRLPARRPQVPWNESVPTSATTNQIGAMPVRPAAVERDHEPWWLATQGSRSVSNTGAPMARDALAQPLMGIYRMEQLPLGTYRDALRRPTMGWYAREAADEALAQATVGAIAACPWWSPIHDRLPPVARSAARIFISMRQGKLLGRIDSSGRRSGAAS